MKNVNLKRLVLSTAVISASSLAFTTATAEETQGVNNYDTPQSQSVTMPNPSDRNITNPNTDDYSNANSSQVNNSNLNNATSEGEAANRNEAANRDASGSDNAMDAERESLSMAEADVDETVHFEPNSVTLTESAEMQLEKVVEQIDKEKPVALTVEVQGSLSEGDMSIQQPTNSATAMNQDSSAGFPADERGVAGARISPTEEGGASIPANSTAPSNNADALESEQTERAQLISRYRAENIRQYLERQGISVVQWEMEGGVTGAAGSGTTDTGFATRNSAGQQGQEEVQQVRIVIIGDVRPEGLSAL